jgi:predicted adenine nucleotide alpha hydrolase (AANH) superfamily ATPase
VVYPILILKDRFELIAYWYDPNIHPEQEYDKRFETFKEICEKY